MQRTNDNVVDVIEAAAIIRAHPVTIKNWIRDGRLVAHRYGNGPHAKFLINLDDLQKLERPAR